MEGGIRIMKRKGKSLLALVIVASMTLLWGMTALAAGSASAGTQTKDEKTKKFGFTYKEVRYELGTDAEAAKKTRGESNGSRKSTPARTVTLTGPIPTGKATARISRCI